MTTLYNAAGNIIRTTDFLTGKTWLCVGDSISTYPGYRQMIVDMYDMNALSGAFQGGMRAGYGGGVSFCILEKLDGISEGTPDIITIALGTNDANSPIGTISDDPDAQSENSYTFMGCYKALITRLFEKYGYVPMMLMTPYQRSGSNVTKIAEAIKEIGTYYSIPVFDVFAESGLPIGTLTDTDDTNHLFAPDGLHINPAGGAISAPKIADKMNLVIQKWEFPATKLVASGGSSRTLTTTDPETVYAYVTPNYSTDFNKIVWTSSDEDVATVVGTAQYVAAEVKAVADGGCVITATLGDFTVSYNITVELA